MLFLAYVAGVLAFTDDWPTRGQLGDLFGGVNALFTALAFAGLIFTAVLQRHELELQREELAATRNELAGQREQLALQNQTFRLQSFESTFFQLLTLHHQIVGALTLEAVVGGEVRAVRGRYAFDAFYQELRGRFIENGQETDPRSEEALNELDELYRSVYEPWQSTFGHYFRNLYHIVKLVDQSELADKRRYTSLVRAQLSSYELACVFYNCLSQEGVSKFKPLVERYSLLKNLPWGLLLNEKHVAHYGAQAFFVIKA